MSDRVAAALWSLYEKEKKGGRREARDVRPHNAPTHHFSGIYQQKKKVNSRCRSQNSASPSAAV